MASAPPGLRPTNAKLEPDNHKPDVAERIFKCAHTCDCLGSSSSTAIADGRSFQRKLGAQSHMGFKSKHPKCTPLCPAYSNRIEPLEILVNEDRPQIGEGSHSSQKRPYEHHTSESSPPAKKARLSSPPRIESASSRRDGSVTISVTPSPLSATLTDTYISAHPEVILRRLSVLKRLRKKLAFLLPELQYLDNSLCLLSCTTAETRHYPYSTKKTADPNKSARDELISILTRVIDSVKSADNLLQTTISVDGGRLPKLRELRRSLSKIQDDLLDLRFDMKETAQRSGVQGLGQERENTKKALDNISSELTNIGGKMDELLLQVVGRLLETRT